MSVDAEIAALKVRAANIADAGRRDRVNLYAEGLAVKIRETAYTLGQLRQLTSRAPQSAPISGAAFSDRVHFYSDSFWAFERSLLDILAQVVNQAENYGLNERVCDFEAVASYVAANHSGTVLDAQFSVLAGAACYSEINDYRNCSLHRRQVYLECHTVQKTYGTPGYATGSFTNYEWYVCDNPLDTNPE